MGPIQYVFIALAITFALIGLARGYAKELGNTIILMSAVAVSGFVIDRYEAVLLNASTNILGVNNAYAFLWLLFSILFIIVVFMSYSGVTFNYAGKSGTGFFASLVSLGVGLFNGYLVAGSLWYFFNRYCYPLMGVQAQLNPQGAAFVNFLPQNLFPDPLWWFVPVGILLVLRVRG